MIVALLADLSQQKKSEEALAAERLARSILEQAGESIVVCDASGRIIRANRSAARLVGRDPLFQAFEAVLPLRTAAAGRPFSLAGRSRSKLLRGLELSFERPDGASFRLLLNADPLRGPELGYVGMVVTLTDVTRLAQAEAARQELLGDLAEANRELAAIDALSAAGLQLASLDQLIHSLVSQVAAAMEADEATLAAAQRRPP